ncbi:hypothetical protein ACF0H5_006099 [Mactra antiquata]
MAFNKTVIDFIYLIIIMKLATCFTLTLKNRNDGLTEVDSMMSSIIDEIQSKVFDMSRDAVVMEDTTRIDENNIFYPVIKDVTNSYKHYKPRDDSHIEVRKRRRTRITSRQRQKYRRLCPLLHTFSDMKWICNQIYSNRTYI